MVGGCKKWEGEDFSSQIFERVNGKWKERNYPLKSAGKATYLGGNKLKQSNDVLMMHGNQDVVLTNKCMKIVTPNYPQNYPSNWDAKVNISFPGGECWNVSMRFQYEFNLEHSQGCLNTFVNITLFGMDNIATNIGPFCGSEIQHNLTMDFNQAPPLEALQIHFRSGDETPQQGFLLKVCKEECCFKNGKPSHWLEWGQWSLPNICPYTQHINTDVRKRNRECKGDCHCNRENVDVDTGGKFEYPGKIHQFLVFSDFPINDFFDMDFHNILSPSPLYREHDFLELKSNIIENWNPVNQVLVSFNKRLYYYRGPQFDGVSRDLESGVVHQHDNILAPELEPNFALIEVNGKIWKTGGINRKNEVLNETFFLLPDFSWTIGPDLPAPRETHTMVGISETEVLILGGNLRGYGRESAAGVWIYNDVHQKYSIMNDFELSRTMSAIKVFIEDLNKEAVLVMLKGKVLFYDWTFDTWIEGDDTWIHPVANFEHIKLFSPDGR